MNGQNGMPEPTLFDDAIEGVRQASKALAIVESELLEGRYVSAAAWVEIVKEELDQDLFDHLSHQERYEARDSA